MTLDLHLIDELLQRRDLKKAEVAIAKRLRARLNNRERAAALLLRARVRLYRGRIDDALDDLEQARKIDPATAELPDYLELLADGHFAHFELASVGFADRMDIGVAADAYQQISQRFPDYDNIGWIAYQQGRIALIDNQVDAAVACFQRALLAPTTLPALTAYCYERLGFVAFYEQRDVKNALSLLNRAVDTYPVSEDRSWLARIHTLRSRVLRDLRQHNASLEAAQTAIAISGREDKASIADALLTAAETLAGMESGEREVIAYLQQFLQISRRPPGIDVTWSRVYEMLGDAYFKTGQHLLSVGAYQAALQFNPYHPWEESLLYRVARSAYHAGDYDTAVESIRRLIRSAEKDEEPVSDYRIYSLLANALYAQQQYPEAADAYAHALRLAPPNAEVLPTLQQYHRLALNISSKVTS